ncbi:MAG: threonylcarbamoyl-AMP synthase [Micavibrio aeruginosavorus]|uniref:Threonylcarbamoyl-AMP synthase n=1 Tax=Micavibrio aeruginosavorus TaxID=349221 RepID=A0A2W5BWS2_9BACT|nr:MAG: threonylcarbamoyl-AMP synthase [Micavibrio aeruginosavorus]
MTKIVTPSADSIAEAAAIVREGGLVAFPTETVYGLGANALDGRAVAGIFAAKNRPAINPVIIHVAKREDAEKFVAVDARARGIMQAFWPGPLTLILPKREYGGVSDLVSAGLPTVAIRMPNHPVALALIEAAGVPIAAPSANASGEPSATTPRHVQESLGGRVPMIIADGACSVGLESTVLDLSGEVPVIARPGAVTAEDLADYLGDVAYDLHNKEKPVSPGQLLKHYAPSIPVRLGAVDVEREEGLLAFGSTKFMGIKGGGFAKELGDDKFRNLSENGDLHEAAANLFIMLRELDNPENKRIAVMNIPDVGLGIAINDRLRRAAQGR